MKLITLLFSLALVAQEIGNKKEIKTNYNLTKESLIYSKENNSKIQFKDLGDLIKKYPESTVIPKEEDVNGNPISYYFLKNGNKTNSNSEQIKIKRKDINGTLFNLEDIKDKYVVVIVQLELEFPMINVKKIKEAEQFAFNRSDCKAIILTTSSNSQSKKIALQQKLKSTVIANASTVINQFNLKRYPSYILLNKDKSINSVLIDHEEIEAILTTLD